MQHWYILLLPLAGHPGQVRLTNQPSRMACVQAARAHGLPKSACLRTVGNPPDSGWNGVSGQSGNPFIAQAAAMHRRMEKVK